MLMHNLTILLTTHNFVQPVVITTARVSFPGWEVLGEHTSWARLAQVWQPTDATEHIQGLLRLHRGPHLGSLLQVGAWRRRWVVGALCLCMGERRNHHVPTNVCKEEPQYRLSQWPGHVLQRGNTWSWNVKCEVRPLNVHMGGRCVRV